MENTDGADTTTFGTALRRARQSASLSLADLARLGHYSKGYLSRIESGERRPTIQLATRFDRLLHTGGALLALVPTARPAGRSSGPGLNCPVRPVQLPPPPTLFTGRDREIGCLEAALTPVGRDVAITVISGMGGVGKTALALAWAHRWSHHFTDGVLFADLCGSGPTRPPANAQDVQTGFLHALGVPARLIPGSAAQTTGLYRSVLYGRRLLVVLDDAADARQIRPLLPGSPAVAVLVTSRSRMAGLCAREGAVPIPLEPFSPDDSRKLAAAILSEASEETLRQLAEVCGHLPLALRLAAHRLAVREPTTVAAGTRSIADRRTRLDLLRSPGDPRG